MIGKNGMESILKYHQQRVEETLKKCFAMPNQVFQVEIDKPDKNGGVKHTLWDFVCLTDELGKPIEIQCCGIDVSDRTQAEKKLQASEMRYRRLFETAKDGIIILNAKTGEIEDVNPFLVDIMGYSKEEFIGKELWEIGLFKDIFANKEAFFKLQKDGQIRYENLPLKTKQGQPLWVEFVSNAYESDGKQVMQCNIRDISARHLAEEGLCASEKKVARNELLYRSLIENISDAIILLNENGNITYQSPSVERITGFAIEDAQDKTAFEFIHPDDLKGAMDFFGKVVANPGVPLKNQYRLQHKQGHYISIEGTITNLLHEENVKAVIINYRDVTEQVQAEKELKALNERLLFHINNSPLGFIEWDGQLRVKAVSKKAEEIFGWTQDEYINAEKNGYSLEYEEDRPWVNRIMQQLLSGEIERSSAQNRNYTKDGRVIWCEWFTSAMKDKDGKVNTLFSLVQDITLRKEVEKEIKELNENLEQRVRERTVELTLANKDLEAFSSTVSHDLRAPARAIKSFAKLIQEEYGEGMKPKEKELFSFIEDSGNRMSEIIDDLLKLARYGNEQLKLEPVNMELLVQGIWLNINRLSASNAILDLKELATVNVDKSMMLQVVINLLSNAIKYSTKKDKPVISVWCEQTKENVTFYFKDNGAGFDMKNYPRLFMAFQRFHSQRDFEGTGVGLSLVKRIIGKHGGTVGAEAKVDEGATFYFTLPVNN